eukprot:TRINITY_DN1919_c0_g9_i1.p1 TRINITY_DN1919_c0_g9~~TRINITY_DN1919_c0_g9_i1.p1  ORF type:complete len:300 (+),score=103.58 TRINITY_DN1919_c0_g9_i1:553-1452(+)
MIYMMTNPEVKEDKEVSVLTLDVKSYSEKLCALRDKLVEQKKCADKVKELEEEIRTIIQEYNKSYEVVINKQRLISRIAALEKEIERKRNDLNKRNELLKMVRDNLEKKREYKNFFSEILATFEEDLEKNQTTLAKNKELLEMNQRVYVARRIKVLFILGYVFFNDKSGSIFKKLLRLKDINTNTEKVDQKIANSLGFVVMLGIMMAKYLNLALTYPMIYNGPRSMIRYSKTEDFPLYLLSKSERTKFLKGIELLIQNFLQIIAYCGIVFKSKYESDPAIQLTEVLICLTNYLSHFFLQ